MQMSGLSLLVLLSLAVANCFYLPSSLHKHHSSVYKPSFYHHPFYPSTIVPYNFFYNGYFPSDYFSFHNKPNKVQYQPPVFTRSFDKYPPKAQPTFQPYFKSIFSFPEPSLNKEGEYQFPPYFHSLPFFFGNGRHILTSFHPSHDQKVTEVQKTEKIVKDGQKEAKKSEETVEDAKKEANNGKKKADKVLDEAEKTRVVVEGGRPGGLVDEQIKQIHFDNDKGFFNYNGEYEPY